MNSMIVISIRQLIIVLVGLLWISWGADRAIAQGEIAAQPPVEWKKHTIVEQANSSINSAQANDFDGDGHIDVIASYGRAVWVHRGPDWKATKVHDFVPGVSRNKPGATCIHSCLIDADQDGKLDFVGSNQTLFWLRCPPEDPLSGKPWKYETLDDVILGSHCVLPGDVDLDGTVDLIANSFQGESKTTVPESICWFDGKLSTRKPNQWKRNVFADKDAPGGSHYMGLGDLNGDGRPDITCGAKGDPFENGNWFAWWEQPADPTAAWKKHLLAENQIGATNIEPADVDGDKHMDIIATRGHGKGVLWFRGPEFELIEIDPTIEFPHTLVVADIDGDSAVDFAVCGSKENGIAAWYRNLGAGEFQRFDIDRGQGSYDFRAYDLDGDGDLDLLNAGHGNKNLVWYENIKK